MGCGRTAVEETLDLPVRFGRPQERADQPVCRGKDPLRFSLDLVCGRPTPRGQQATPIGSSARIA